MALTLSEVRSWLKIQAGSLSDDDLQAAWDGEAANQNRVCRIPTNGVLPADLELALRYRVARAVSSRKGVVVGVGDGGQGTSPSRFDSYIDRLEGPLRKLIAG